MNNKLRDDPSLKNFTAEYGLSLEIFHGSPNEFGAGTYAHLKISMVIS